MHAAFRLAPEAHGDGPDSDGRGFRASVTAVEVDGFDGLLPDGGGVDSLLTGEAVVVEIAPGRYLFVLLTGALGWADAAYGLGGPGTVFEENMRSAEAQRGEPPVPLPPKAWPLMVTFADIADPKTVARVDPDDLAAHFGPGVRLKAVTLAVTEEPVTAGKVKAVLGWLVEAGRLRFNVAMTPDGDVPLNAFLSLDRWSE